MKKVFIPCAGLGQRLGKLTINLNKALVSLGHKPLISMIIEKFDPDTNFVIALGYKGHILKEYLDLVYPNLKIEFVEIPIYEGKKSSLGVTLLECQSLLNEPFIFWACDTIILDKIPNITEDWIGVSTKEKNLLDYRSVREDEKILTKIYSKNYKYNKYPYIGIAGIHSYKEFWEILNSASFNSLKSGEVFAINEIAKNNEVQIKKFKWIDAGNQNDLERNQKFFVKKGINILPKDDENIWFANKLVTKFSVDNEFIRSRIKRAKLLYPYVPSINAHGKYMYSYNFVEGEVFSKKINKENFSDLLDFCKNFWRIKQNINLDNFYKDCYKFYYKKTIDRLSKIKNLDDKLDKITSINNVRVLSIHKLIKDIDWDKVSKGIPSRFHGDFHFENILITNRRFKYTLLDWRQDFSGNIEYGDLYYDLAKIYHGIIVSHEQVTNNKFSIAYENKNKVIIKIKITEILEDSEKILRSWVEKNNYDFQKVVLLTALIYLNISPLHHYDYNDFLFYLGKLMLQNLHDNKNVHNSIQKLIKL